MVTSKCSFAALGSAAFVVLWLMLLFNFKKKFYPLLALMPKCYHTKYVFFMEASPFLKPSLTWEVCREEFSSELNIYLGLSL